MNIQRAILKVLDDCDPYLLPESSLLDAVNLKLGRRLTLGTLQDEAGKLEGLRHVLSVESADRGTQWKITDNGKARLRE